VRAKLGSAADNKPDGRRSTVTVSPRKKNPNRFGYAQHGKVGPRNSYCETVDVVACHARTLKQKQWGFNPLSCHSVRLLVIRAPASTG
jgi:hypothetical protein